MADKTKTRAERIEEAARDIARALGDYPRRAMWNDMCFLPTDRVFALREALALPPDQPVSDNESTPMGGHGDPLRIEEHLPESQGQEGSTPSAGGSRGNAGSTVGPAAASEGGVNEGVAGSTPASGATYDDEAIKAWSERWAQCWNSVSLRLPRDVLDRVRDAGIESVVTMHRLAREKIDLRAEVEQALAWHKVASSERDELRAEVERLRADRSIRDAEADGERIKSLTLKLADAERSIAMRDRAVLQLVRRSGNGIEGIGVMLLKDDAGYFEVHWSRGAIEDVCEQGGA